MTHDLEENLRTLLVKKGKLGTGAIDLTFDAPDREWAGKLTKPTVNLFLYDIHENMDYRQNYWVVERHGRGPFTKSKPPLWIDVSYLVTVWASAVEDEHRLIWHIHSGWLPSAKDSSGSGWNRRRKRTRTTTSIHTSTRFLPATERHGSGMPILARTKSLPHQRA